MAFPGYPLADDKTNRTLAAGDHAAHHNALAAACNDLQTQADAPVTSARLADFTLQNADFADGAVTYPKLAASAIPPARVTATGSAFTGITTTETTVCSLNLPDQGRGGEWLITWHLVIEMVTPTAVNYFTSNIKNGSVLLSNEYFGGDAGLRETVSGTIIFALPGGGTRTINHTIQRWFGSATSVTTTNVYNQNHIEAKWWAY